MPSSGDPPRTLGVVRVAEQPLSMPQRNHGVVGAVDDEDGTMDLPDLVVTSEFIERHDRDAGQRAKRGDERALHDQRGHGLPPSEIDGHRAAQRASECDDAIGRNPLTGHEVVVRRVFVLVRAPLRRPPAAGPVTFVVVGGGPTGTELAGTLAEISRHVLANEFRSISPATTKIMLLEGGPRVLPAYSEDLSAKAQQQLERLGVEVRTSNIVTGIEPGVVLVGNTRIPAQVVLWAAGVAASPLGCKLDAPIDRAGRVHVQPDLSLPGHPEVFVIGDLASLQDEYGKMLPGVAPVALQQGKWVAKTIARDLDHQPRRNFHYHDKGSLATIGRAAGVAQFPRFSLSGYFAWLAWLFIHIFFLIGFRNRLIVTYERGARLITGSNELPGWTEARRQDDQTVGAGKRSA